MKWIKNGRHEYKLHLEDEYVLTDFHRRGDAIYSLSYPGEPELIIFENKKNSIEMRGSHHIMCQFFRACNMPMIICEIKKREDQKILDKIKNENKT